MNIAIDLGKRMSYVVIEDNDKVIKEGYVETKKESFQDFFGDVSSPKIIVEASSTTNWIANMFDGYDITIAHPAKVRLIAQSVKKTDKIDAHTVMDLYKKDYLPKSHLSEKDVRDARDLCRDRSLLIRQRVATINKIKYHAFCIGINVKHLGKRAMKVLSKEPKLELLIRQLENTDEIIKMYNERIEEIVKNGNSRVSHYARLIDTIPGFGPYSSFIIAAEIDDVNRFPDEFRLFSHVGVVPRIYQSGDKEWKGHITKGNTFLKTTLLQCANIHIMRKKNSMVTCWYDDNKYRIGKKKAKIAVMKRLLRIIYWMLKRDEEYHDR
jgi:transposase